MNRRNFIQTTGISLASILIGDSISSFSSQKTRLLISLPDEVTVTVNGQRIKIMKSESNESPFQATRRFTKIMCDKARMPKLLLLSAAFPLMGIA